MNAYVLTGDDDEAMSAAISALSSASWVRSDARMSAVEFVLVADEACGIAGTIEPCGIRIETRAEVSCVVETPTDVDGGTLDPLSCDALRLCKRS